MALKPSVITLSANNFVAEESELLQNGISREQAKELYENGGFMGITDLPDKGIEVGIDYRTFRVTQKFMGFKMIPPGLHFFTLRYKDAPIISFFLWFELGNVFVLKWNKQREDLEETYECKSASDDSIERLLKNYDDRLACYPFTQLNQWRGLVSHISEGLYRRLKPANQLGKYNEEIEFVETEEDLRNLKSCSEWISVKRDESGRLQITDTAGLPIVKERRGYVIFYTDIPELDPNAVKRKRLGILLDRMPYKEILGEFQYAFIVFMVGQSHTGGLLQWKKLLHLLCDCGTHLKDRNDLLNEFIVILYSQLKLFEDGPIEEIFYGDKYLCTVLPLIFANIEDSDDTDPTLKRRGLQLRTFCEKKFQQSFVL